MPLHDLLTARREDVIRRWQEQIQGTLAPELMAPLELRNHIPEFVSEIVVALRDAAGLASAGPAPEESQTAAGHGAQRLRLGFSLDSVVREYGALRDAIVAEARQAGLELTFGELQIVFDCIISGTAHAVSEYARQRDAELLRLANEHFGFIAHELRNPLWSATMALDMLQSSGHLPTENRLVGSLTRGLQRARELIDQTLQTARIASGIDLRTQSTTLRALFEGLEQDIASDADAKRIELQSTIESDEPLDVDLRLIRSALGNLLRNAVKYTKSGGTVHLRGRVASARAVIEVEDCCGGLEPGKVEAAFAPFVRLDHRQSGFGLGLAIAKQAVDAHGGNIRVQNLPGQGCIFVLELPVAPPSTPAQAPG